MKTGTQVWFKDSDGDGWVGFVNSPDPDRPEKIFVTATDEKTGGGLKRFWLDQDEIIRSHYSNKGPDILG